MQFNPLPLLAVKLELDNLLGQVSRDLEIYFAAPEANREALQSAFVEFHRICDMLQALPLDGVMAFCGEIEAGLQESLAGMLPPSSVCRSTLQNALLALAHHLDTLADGANRPALCLFPQYQELRQVRGIEMAFEVDLFFPDLQVELPPSVLAQPPGDAPQAHINAERGKYQAALLKWMRQDNPIGALQSMRSAVQTVMECMPQNQQRAFWWVASALLDCMIYQGLSSEQDAKKLLSRIDLQMKLLSDGQFADPQDSLREMLYLIARNDGVSNTVSEVKRVYALESYLPQAGALPVIETEQVLESMRAQLEKAKESWEECVRVGLAAPEFSGHLERLVYLAEQLDHNTLQHLCQQIQDVVSQERSIEQIQHIALDMAMALLLLGSGIGHYRQLGGEFHKQVRILVQRLQAAIVYAAQDENKLADLVSLYCGMEGPGVMATLLGEIQINLQHIELGLKSFPGNTCKHAALTQYGLLLHQVLGGLHMLSLDQPEQLLRLLRKAVEYFAAGGSPTQGEIHTVVEALNALQAYVHGLAHENKSDSAVLDTALQDMQALQQALFKKIPEIQQTQDTAAQTVAANALWEGDELLEVFLEEAQEVLDSMRANLEILQLQPDSHEPLVIIRRGFHTLKGSGRMVGLADLAEVAWAVERAMNKWLQENKHATPGLLKFILGAETAFKGWVDTLRTQGNTQVEAGELIKAAQQIEAGAEAVPVVQPDKLVSISAPSEISVALAATEPEQKLEPEPELEHKPEQPPPAVGIAALSPSQFGIAMEEAAQHVASLMWHLTELRESAHPAVSNDFLQEAYTLAVISRTMGFTPTAELAYALEQWLEAHVGHPLALSNAQLSLLERTVAVLDDMDMAARNRQELKAQPELIARLQADRELAGQVKASQPAPEISLPKTFLAESSAVQQRIVQDDVDEHLLPIFLEEASDIFPHIGSNMRAWREKPENKALGRSLHRILHTLKGSARMAGAMHMGDLTHRMEECVVQAMSQTQHDMAVHDELDDYFDRIGNALEQLRSEKFLADQAAAPAVPQDAAQYISDASAKHAMLRVRSGTVERLVNGAGEISATRTRIEAELRNFKTGLLELAESVNRLRAQLREVEIQAEGQMQARISLSENTAEKFDPLEFDRFTRLQELTRFMNESVHDVLTVQQILLKNLDEASAALSTQTYLNRELQQNLMAIRMVPFTSISERLYRIVRQTCKELGKKARLELHGDEVELDRSMLDRITAPLEHMLRNAIAHGLESPPQRERMGKPPIGVISLSLHQEDNEVIFEFSDDGAGINLARLRQKAVELGMLQADENMGDEQVMQLIFAPGVTTATEVTEVSGRGIGMDVVRSEITALGGRIEVSSKREKGTRFISHLPLTLAAIQALLVRAGQAVHAIPSSVVEQVQQVKPAALKAIYRQGCVEWKGRQYPLHYLPRLLGNEECVPTSHPYNRILLLHSSEQRLAVHVDDLIGTQEIVFKNMGPQLAHLSGIAGATVLGNGNVALILNPVQLVQRFMSTRKTTKAAAVEPTPAPPLVMVVDDSLTVRKITSRLLVRAGYHVATAKDGVDALEQLGEISPSIILLDIEMPRMDGFELATHLRSDPKTQHLPIIMITSRTAEKHRAYAHELGVNAYLGKPYQEEELLQYIAAMSTASISAPASNTAQLLNPQTLPIS